MKELIELRRSFDQTYFDSNINVSDRLCPRVVFSHGSVVTIRIFLKHFLLFLQICLFVLFVLLAFSTRQLFISYFKMVLVIKMNAKTSYVCLNLLTLVNVLRNRRFFALVRFCCFLRVKR